MNGILLVLGLLAFALAVGVCATWILLNCTSKHDEKLRIDREDAMRESALELQQQFEAIDRMRRNGF